MTHDAIAKALSHPLRRQVLKLLRDSTESRSPNELAQQLAEQLTNMSYHVRQLAELDMIVLDTTEPKRGALEHFYRLSQVGRDALDVLEVLETK
jgi:DNA-binding transcriptional ArsR family regulator